MLLKNVIMSIKTKKSTNFALNPSKILCSDSTKVVSYCCSLLPFFLPSTNRYLLLCTYAGNRTPLNTMIRYLFSCCYIHHARSSKKKRQKGYNPQRLYRYCPWMRCLAANRKFWYNGRDRKANHAHP